MEMLSIKTKSDFTDDPFCKYNKIQKITDIIINYVLFHERKNKMNINPAPGVEYAPAYAPDTTRVNPNINPQPAPVNGRPETAKPENANGTAEKIQNTATCYTCANRRYQDVSNDAGVSMQSPTKIAPEQAASMVMAHEREHYSREASKAEQDGREVLSNDIRLFTSICPECGKTYVSGGETRTVTRKRAESDVFLKDFFEKSVGRHLPKRIDERA